MDKVASELIHQAKEFRKKADRLEKAAAMISGKKRKYKRRKKAEKKEEPAK